MQTLNQHYEATMQVLEQLEQGNYSGQVYSSAIDHVKENFTKFYQIIQGLAKNQKDAPKTYPPLPYKAKDQQAYQQQSTNARLQQEERQKKRLEDQKRFQQLALEQQIKTLNLQKQKAEEELVKYRETRSEEEEDALLAKKAVTSQQPKIPLATLQQKEEPKPTYDQYFASKSSSSQQPKMNVNTITNQTTHDDEYFASKSSSSQQPKMNIIQQKDTSQQPKLTDYMSDQDLALLLAKEQEQKGLYPTLDMDDLTYFVQNSSTSKQFKNKE